MMETAAPQALPNGYGEWLLVTFLALALLCLLAAAAVRFGARRLRRAGFHDPHGRAGQGSGPIRVLARAPLEVGHSLYLVEVAGKSLVVGASASGLRVLCQFDTDATDALLAACARPPERARGFAAALWAALRRAGAGGQGDGKGDDG